MFISSKILGYEEAVFGDQGGRDYFALLPKQLQNLIKNKTIQNSKQLFSDIEKGKQMMSAIVLASMKKKVQREHNEFADLRCQR